MIDFPSNPIVDEEYTDDNNTLWIYNGHNWERTFNEKIHPSLALKDIGDVVIGDVVPTGEDYLVHNGAGYSKLPWNYKIPVPAQFSVYKSTALAEPAELTPTLISYNIVHRDTHSKYSTSTYEYEIPISGYWVIQTRNLMGDSRERMKIMLYKNGVFNKTLMQEQGCSYEYNLTGITLDHFTVGDKLKIMVEGQWYNWGFQTGYKNSNFYGYLVQAD